MTNALVIFGSHTNENSYGETSGRRVANALKSQGWNITTMHATQGREVMRILLDAPPDLVIPVGFGPPCEDGHIFAAAQLAGVPCAGPTPTTGSLMQDKATFSLVVDAVFAEDPNVRSPIGIVVRKSDPVANITALARTLKSPLVVKPNYSGSSDGLYVAATPDDAVTAAIAMLDREGKVLIQQLEAPVLHEISCTVLDSPDGPHFLPIVELQRKDVMVLGAEEKFGDGGLDRHIIPATLNQRLANHIEFSVLKLHKAVGSYGLTRTDILVLTDGVAVVLESNGIPGLLTSSIACDAASAAGIDFEELAMLYAKSAFTRRSESAVWGNP